MTLLVLVVCLLAGAVLAVVVATLQQDAHRRAGLLPARDTGSRTRRR
jgi:hypothetical protein